MSLKQFLYETIKTQGFVGIITLRKLAESNGYISSNCERRLRELREEGLITRITNHKGVVTDYKIGSKLPCLDKTPKNAQSTVNDKKEAIIPITATNQAPKTEVEELQSKAQSLLRNIKIGDKRFIEANLQYKALKNAKTDRDKIRILNQIIYILKKTTSN